MDAFEVWRNTGQGRIIIRRMNELGGYRHESIRGGGEVHLSEQERRYNQSLSTPEQDPFANSMLIRVDIDTDTPDDKMPAMDQLSDDRIDSLLDVHWKTMEKELGKISSIPAIRRILVRAEETGASAKRLEQLRTRLHELQPDAPLPRQVTRAVTVDSDIAEPHEVDIYNMGPNQGVVAGGRV
jgi:hypothetical protein